jgi:hypothetical protein
MSAPEEARTAQEAFQTLQAQFGGLADVADTAIAIGRRVIAERDALLAEVENAKLCARHTPERDHNGVLCRECANAEVVALRRERDRLREALQRCLAANLATGEANRNSTEERAAYRHASAALADTADGRPACECDAPRCEREGCQDKPT